MVCRSLVNDYFFLHEPKVSGHVSLGLNGTNLSTFLVDEHFELVFEFLLQVEILKIVDDREVIDEFAALRQECVSPFAEAAVHYTDIEK